MKRFFLAAGTALVLACSAVHAQPAGAGDIELRHVAETEQEVKTPDGKTEKRRVPVQQAVPGTEVVYTSTFRNIGQRSAGNISIVNPVPANTTLVGGSAFGENADTVYSIDGGKTWGAADKLVVVGPDGRRRAAAPSDITHIRWTYRGELPAGKQSSVGFRVVVN